MGQSEAAPFSAKPESGVAKEAAFDQGLPRFARGARMLESWRALSPYGLAVVSVGTTTVIAYFLEPYAQLADLVMIHLVGVVLVALRAGVWLSISAGAVSILAFDYMFIPPVFSTSTPDGESILTFLVMTIVAAVVSGLNARLREQERSARVAASRNEALYRLSLELARANEPEQLTAIARRHIEQLFASRAIVLLAATGQALETASLPSDPQDRELAMRAWSSRDFAAGKSRLGYATWVPLVSTHEPLGVVGILTTHPVTQASDESLLLAACANQLATAIERLRLAQAAHRSELEAETERLRSSLLSAVSHDLKTPLSTMIAAGSTLLSRKKDLPKEAENELLSTIVVEGERLSRLIQNLLSITRLESPVVPLRRTPEAPEEIIAAALARLKTRLGGRTVRVDVASELPWVSSEPALIEQVLINLLENAVAYTPKSATLFVSAAADGDFVRVQVADDGPGIPEFERHKVFEKFYRGSAAGKGDGGVGLGLTICRAIVRAHGGRIDIRERGSGGTVVEFTLPVARNVTLLPSEVA
jgi:two-component system sensor histidine kinase KdpD